MVAARRALSAIALLLLVGCGSAPVTPKYPTVTLMNSLAGRTIVDAPGVHSVEVACGDEAQIHPTGPLPWTIDVRSSKAGRVTVTENLSVIWMGMDRTGHLNLTVAEPGGHGPGPACPENPA